MLTWTARRRSYQQPILGAAGSVGKGNEFKLGRLECPVSSERAEICLQI